MKKTIVAGLALSALAAVYFWPHEQTRPKTNHTATLTTASSSAANSTSANNAPASANTISSNSSAPEGMFGLGPEMDVRLIKLKPAYNAWRRARGYGEFDLDGTPKDYFQYSDEQLRQLMAQDDMFAIQALATKELQKKGNRIQRLNNAKALCLQAAERGSLYALNELTSIDSELFILHAKKEPEIARQYKLDAEAWSVVRELRNELLAGWLRKNLLVESQLADQSEIQQRAQVFYDELAKQRRAQNLPDFDNSPSELEQVMLAEFERRQASGAGKTL